jgi:hypothetical protein
VSDCIDLPRWGVEAEWGEEKSWKEKNVDGCCVVYIRSFGYERDDLMKSCSIFSHLTCQLPLVIDMQDYLRSITMGPV